MKPHIYFQRYPNGVGFWKIRRVGKKHSRISPEEGKYLRPAREFVNRLNYELEGNLCALQSISARET